MIKKYKRARPRAADPVSISVAITPPGDLSATSIFDSHRRITLRNHTSYSVLSAHSMTLVLPPTSHSLSLSLSPFLIRADCTTTGHQAPRESMHDSVTSKSRQDEEGYIVQRPPKRGSYRAASCFLGERGVTQVNVSFVCRNACLALARTAPGRNFEIFYNY